MQGARRTDSQQGQALVLLAGAIFLVLVGAGMLGALANALLGRGRYQRAADLAAISAARSMREDFSRLFEPSRDARGRLNPSHLGKGRYLSRARKVAIETARLNGVALDAGRVTFPDHSSFAPVRVRVGLDGSLRVHSGMRERSDAVSVKASAEAELAVPASGELDGEQGNGYPGPFAYRQGKPMRPDVALAFDRMLAAAHEDGTSLIIASAYRSDAEQARLYAEHPDPRWVAPPGKSLHRLATELDLGPPGAYGWLARNAPRFHFVQRYQWEAWHYGYSLNPRSTPGRYRRSQPDDGPSALPSFVPPAYGEPIARAASRWNVSAALLAAQLYVESNFNPFAVSGAGARGIAQFMPGTARTYGLDDAFDAERSIAAQAHLMRDLLRRFGSVPLALAAYNAGPGAVERCGCTPALPETQAYVAKVLGLIGGAGDPEASRPLEVRLVS